MVSSDLRLPSLLRTQYTRCIRRRVVFFFQSLVLSLPRGVWSLRSVCTRSDLDLLLPIALTSLSLARIESARCTLSREISSDLANRDKTLFPAIPPEHLFPDWFDTWKTLRLHSAKCICEISIATLHYETIT